MLSIDPLVTILKSLDDVSAILLLSEALRFGTPITLYPPRARCLLGQYFLLGLPGHSLHASCSSRLSCKPRRRSIDEVDAEEVQDHTAEDEIGKCSIHGSVK
jgi:hypothetical protein